MAVDADIVHEIAVRCDPLARHLTGQRNYLPMSNVGRIQAFRRVQADRPINAIDGRGGDLFRPIKYLSDVLGQFSTGFERRAAKLSDPVWNSRMSVGCQRQSSNASSSRVRNETLRADQSPSCENTQAFQCSSMVHDSLEWSTTHWMGPRPGGWHDRGGIRRRDLEADHGLRDEGLTDGAIIAWLEEAAGALA
jgi:hypothetical protein